METTSRLLWLEINRGRWVCPEVEAEQRAGTRELASGRWESSPRHEVIETQAGGRGLERETSWTPLPQSQGLDGGGAQSVCTGGGGNLCPVPVLWHLAGFGF